MIYLPHFQPPHLNMDLYAWTQRGLLVTCSLGPLEDGERGKIVAHEVALKRSEAKSSSSFPRGYVVNVLLWYKMKLGSRQSHIYTRFPPSYIHIHVQLPEKRKRKWWPWSLPALRCNWRQCKNAVMVSFNPYWLRILTTPTLTLMIPCCFHPSEILTRLEIWQQSH